MSIVWIIENFNQTDHSITNSLMGNFPVRVFSSFASFQKLAKIKKQALPNLIVCSLDNDNPDAFKLERVLKVALPNARLIFVGPEPRPPQLEEASIYVNEAIDPLNLSCLVEHLLSQKQVKNFCVVYKDVILDLSLYALKCASSGHSEKLPMKEAQILKLLIEKKGGCVSRQQIQNEIWCDVCVSSRTIDSHVSRLRKKLEATEISIESVYGGGYSLR